MTVGTVAAGSWPFACRDAELAEIEAASPLGAVILAGPGVGKTRLLGELANRAESDGRRIVRVVGSRSLAPVPLGVFVGTLDAPLGRDVPRFEVLHEALGQLTGGRAATDVVLAVDDAHLLDDASAGLVRLAAQTGARVLASVRRGEPCPEAVTGLWKDDLAIRVDLEPVDRGRMAEILRCALGSPVDGRTGHRLWDVTQGNLLFLRELVRNARVEGTFVERGGVWSWSGSSSDSAGVRDLVLDRVDRLDRSVRDLVEVVAVGEPLSPNLLARLHSDETLAEAESVGIVAVASRGLRHEVRLIHPVYSDVVRDQLSAPRLASLSATLAASLVATGARRDRDALRIASLQLDAGGPVDRDVLSTAARQAQQTANMALLERLARKALSTFGDVQAALMLAEVLYWEGHHDEVIELLGDAVLDHAPGDQVTEGVLHVANSWFWGRGRLTEAEYWLAWGIERVGRPYELELRGQYAQMLMFAGRAVESIETGRAVLDDPDASPVARLRAYAGLLSSAAVCGRLDEVDAEVPIAYGAVMESGVDAAYISGGVVVGSFISRMFGGGLPEIDNMLDAMHAASVQRIDDPFRGAWAFLRGRSMLAQGRLGDAEALLRESCASLRERDPGSMLPWALAALAQVLGMTEDARGATAAMAELDAILLAGIHNLDVDIELGRAWAAAARGERTMARDIAEAIARRLRAEQKIAIAAMAFHHALRLGADPSRVSSELDAIAEMTNGAVIAAMSKHARGLARSDLASVLEAADAFEAVGNLLDAAEASAGASRLAAEAGLRVVQRDASVRSAQLAARCGAVLTPMLETAVGRQALSSLTRREQEVALLAGRGLSKREIAGMLDLSVRTVGNHINHVYGKLGITSRDELRVLVGSGDGS